VDGRQRLNRRLALERHTGQFLNAARAPAVKQEAQVKRYRIRKLNVESQSWLTFKLACDNDAHALAECEEISQSSTVEIWDGERLVSRNTAGSDTVGIKAVDPALVQRILKCGRCGKGGMTKWSRDVSAPLHAVDLQPSFYLRVKRTDNRSGAELACMTCDLAQPWPQHSPAM
jgi:hypothetical protein